MTSAGMRGSIQLGINAPGKLPIQPTPGNIRKAPSTKPKQRKSRTGCMTCKAKRLKCDERKPYCEQCTKKGIQCEGYAKNFKWKSFEDIQEQKKNAPVRRKSSSMKRSEDDDLTELMMMDHDGRPEYSRSPAQLMPPPRGPSQYNSPFSLNNFSSPGWPSNFDLGSPNGFTNGFSTNSPLGPSPKSDKSPMDLESILCPIGPNIVTPIQFLTSKLEPEAILPEVGPQQELVTKTPPPLQGIQPLWKEIQWNASDESSDDEEVEEIIRDENSELVRSPKRRRLNSGLSFDVYNFHDPHDEMRMWDFYDTVTCKILSCKNAQGENPWRDDLISRARDSDPLKHALFALTRFHMKRYIPGESWEMSNLGLSHTNASFQALHKVMNDGLAFDENNIAAMLVLSFSQVWDDPRLDGRAHVLGASKILDRQLRQLARKNKQASPFLRFLYNTWLYLDVLSSLSSGEDPYYLNFSNSSPTMSPATSPISDKGSPSGFSLQNEIDSLLGCAGDLFPLIARMSRVSNRLTDKIIEEDDIQYIEEALKIRHELDQWTPPSMDILEASSDINCTLEDIISTAETYRQTALLHLYNSFPPLGKNIEQLADQILNRLLLIPKDSGSLCIHIWPLMASGCEHTDPIKRAQVRDRFEDIRLKLMVANVDSAIQLLEEVWKRRDAGDRTAGWASLARERGWHLLLG